MFNKEQERSIMRMTFNMLSGALNALAIVGIIASTTLMARAEVLNLPVQFASVNAEVSSTQHKHSEVSSADLQCLAENIYFEAGIESYAGKVAVALVTLTRVNDHRYPNSICEVVKEGPIKESWKTASDPDLPENERVYYPRRNRCQFSWYCDGKADTINENSISWQQSQEVAYKVAVLGMYAGMIEHATHYHATYVSPEWRHEVTLVGRIDTHIFYRWD
jgi:spore germination cell wall hydrolase CwlJ-like protein